ncbi:hypothetical protein FB451DRAFT_1212499 [Mycena latifolia]|nr:hypothetical protein FB451DRAFT_1212499 [Mycena latifolia]
MKAAAYDALPDIPLRQSTSLHIFHRPRGSTESRNVDTDAPFAVFRNLADTALTHLSQGAASDIILSHLFHVTVVSPTAHAAFERKFGQAPSLAQMDTEICSYLNDTPPAIVFTHLENSPSGHVVWGQVRDNGENEMLLSLELMEAILGPVPAALAQEESARLSASHRLAWLISFMHEIMHCLSKHLFSDIRASATNAGRTFERLYMKFNLEMVSCCADQHNSRRMWFPKTHLVARLQDKRGFILDLETIARLNLGFSKHTMWDISKVLDQFTLDVDDAMRVRCPIGSSFEEEAETSGSESTDTPPAPVGHGVDMVIVPVGCAGRGWRIKTDCT